MMFKFKEQWMTYGCHNKCYLKGPCKKRQMMSDIFESEVVVPESYESSCLGACILGLYATGKIDSFEVVSEMVGSTFTHTPEKAAAREYRQFLPIFIHLSRVLE